jgi:hypothetical protein
MTVEQFADLIRASQTERMAREYPNLSAPSIQVHKRRKYTLVDIDHSGVYMIENETGNIYGILAYGKINRKHFYGNLATADQWNWSLYRAVRRV